MMSMGPLKSEKAPATKVYSFFLFINFYLLGSFFFPSFGDESAFSSVVPDRMLA